MSKTRIIRDEALRAQLVRSLQINPRYAIWNTRIVVSLERRVWYSPRCLTKLDRCSLFVTPIVRQTIHFHNMAKREAEYVRYSRFSVTCHRITTTLPRYPVAITLQSNTNRGTARKTIRSETTETLTKEIGFLRLLSSLLHRRCVIQIQRNLPRRKERKEADWFKCNPQQRTLWGPPPPTYITATIHT